MTRSRLRAESRNSVSGSSVVSGRPMRAVLAGLFSIGLVTSGCASDASAPQSSGAAPASELALPEPSGVYEVGTRSLHLVDENRADPWKPKTGPRELMTSLWYPAGSAGGAPAEYMSKAVSREYIKLYPDSVRIPPETLSTVRTNATTNAGPASGNWPLIVLSPGFGHPRAMLTGLAEELASQGYVVLAVDHNYEGPIEFPDGRVTKCGKPMPCAARTPADMRRVVENRAADLSFALEELTGSAASWPGARFVDTSRIGVAGHSLGGASAAELARTDDRVDAGVNMDGTFYKPNSLAGLDSPFLLLGNGIRQEKSEFDPSWAKAWPNLTGWKRGLLVKKTGHSSFTDAPTFIDQLGVRDQYPPEQVESVLGSIPSERATTITREYVVSMFEQHLKDRWQWLLDQPSPNHPEVVFWKKGQS